MASLIYSLSVTFCFARIFCGFCAVCDQFIVSIVKVYVHLYLESHRLKVGSNACGVGKPAYPGEPSRRLSYYRNLTPFDTNWKKGSGATPLTTQDL